VREEEEENEENEEEKRRRRMHSLLTEHNWEFLCSLRAGWYSLSLSLSLFRRWTTLCKRAGADIVHFLPPWRKTG
jgi:hypothetical protein